MARLVEGADDYAGNCVVDVSVFIDDACGITTKLQNYLFLAGLGFELPAHFRRSGEGEEFEAAVGGEEVGIASAAGKNAEGSGRQVGFGEDFAENEGADGGEGCGFEHEGASGGNGRSDFVGGKVDGEIERRDEGAGSDGEPLGDGLVSFGSG